MTGETVLRRAFFFLSILGLVGAMLYWARPVMIPVTLAVLTAFVLSPVVRRIERWGVPRVVASTATLVGAGIVMIAIGQALISQMGPLAAEVPTFKAQASEKIDEVRKAAADSGIVGMLNFAKDLGNKPDDHGPPPHESTEGLTSKFEIPVMAVLQSVAGTTVAILLDVVLVFILALLILMRREDLRNRMIQLLGTDNRVTVTRAIDDASKRVSRFLFIQLLINLAFGTVVTIGLLLIGIPFPYVWGALAALFRYVPFLGGWISALFPLMISLVMPNWTPFLMTAAFFLVVELLQANLVEPLVFGHSVGVSAPGQVVAMLFWALLWGPVGLILATPLTACLCVLGHHFPALRFFATLMGDGEIGDQADAFYQRLLAGDPMEATALAVAYRKEHSVAAVVDEVMIPAILASRADVKNGDITKDDQIAIADSLREIYYEILPAPDGAQDDAKPVAKIRPAGHKTSVMVIEFPFNDELDDLVIALLQDTVQAAADTVTWTKEAINDLPLDPGSRLHDAVPTLIVISTTAKRNLARIRGAYKTVRERFPDALVLVCCWCLDSETDAAFPRVKDPGQAVACTTFRSAQKLIESMANVNVDACPAAPVAVS